MNICSLQHANPAPIFLSPTFALFCGPLFVAVVKGVFGVFWGGRLFVLFSMSIAYCQH